MMGGFPSIFLKFANKLAEYFFNKYSANLLCQYFKKTEVFLKFANKLAEYFFNKYSANLLCQYFKKSGPPARGEPYPKGEGKKRFVFSSPSLWGGGKILVMEPRGPPPFTPCEAGDGEGGGFFPRSR